MSFPHAKVVEAPVKTTQSVAEDGDPCMIRIVLRTLDYGNRGIGGLFWISLGSSWLLLVGTIALLAQLLAPLAWGALEARACRHGHGEPILCGQSWAGLCPGHGLRGDFLLICPFDGLRGDFLLTGHSCSELGGHAFYDWRKSLQLRKFFRIFGGVFLEVCETISGGIWEVFGGIIEENYPDQKRKTYFR